MTVYKATWMHESIDENGVYVHVTEGTLSECGQWVDVGEVRYRCSPLWRTSKNAAEADMADAIEERGHRLVNQAKRLREAVAKTQEVTT